MAARSEVHAISRTIPPDAGATELRAALGRRATVPLALLEASAGLILAAGGLWTHGATPWLLLAAVAAIAVGPLLAHDQWRRPREILRMGKLTLRVSNVPLWLALLGVTLATIAEWWAGPWALALAGLARAEDSFRGTRWAGPCASAAYHASTLHVGMALGAGGALPSQQVGAFVAVAAYAVLVFARSILLDRDPESGPGVVPASAALLACAWILLAVPVIPFIASADLFGRAIALVAVVWSGFGVFRAVTELGERGAKPGASWPSVAWPTPFPFLAGITLLTWTNLAVLVAITMLATAAVLRRYPKHSNGLTGARPAV